MGERDPRHLAHRFPKALAVRLLGAALLAQADGRHFQQPGCDALGILRVGLNPGQDDHAVGRGRQPIQVRLRAVPSALQGNRVHRGQDRRSNRVLRDSQLLQDGDLAFL
jgi:hypothetical protein